MPTIEELETALAIDQNALERACKDQPMRFYAVAKLIPAAISQRDAARKELKEVEAQVDIEIRAEAAQRDERVTEAIVAARVCLNPRVREAGERVRKISLRVGKLEALREAFQDRSRMLNKLVDLYIANYFGSEASSTPRHMRAVTATAARIKRQTHG